MEKKKKIENGFKQIPTTFLAGFATARRYKQTKCPTAKGQKNAYIMQWSFIQQQTEMRHGPARTQRRLGDITLREISHTPKD